MPGLAGLPCVSLPDGPRSTYRLRTEVLATLPRWPWMTAVITPLEPHPNDPGPDS